MNENKKILIAKITSAHGIKGNVKLVSFCKKASDLENYSCFFDDDSSLKIKIINKNNEAKTRSGDSVFIAQIEGVDNRNDAEKLKDKEIFTFRDEFEELSDDEFYFSDLIGLNLIFEDKKIGKVLNVVDFGAGVMLEVEFDKEDKSRNLSKFESFPFENAYFGDVDLKNQTIEIKLPEVVLIDSL